MLKTKYNRHTHIVQQLSTGEDGIKGRGEKGGEGDRLSRETTFSSKCLETITKQDGGASGHLAETQAKDSILIYFLTHHV